MVIWRTCWLLKGSYRARVSNSNWLRRIVTIFFLYFYTKGPKLELANYLFCGDFGDDTGYFFETALYLFALKVLSPGNIHLIRGNYETRNEQTAFHKKTEASLGKELSNAIWHQINKVSIATNYHLISKCASFIGLRLSLNGCNYRSIHTVRTRWYSEIYVINWSAQQMPSSMSWSSQNFSCFSRYHIWRVIDSRKNENCKFSLSSFIIYRCF